MVPEATAAATHNEIDEDFDVGDDLENPVVSNAGYIQADVVTAGGSGDKSMNDGGQNAEHHAPSPATGTYNNDINSGDIADGEISQNANEYSGTSAVAANGADEF